MKPQQNFDNIRFELDPNKVLFVLNNEGVIVFEEFRDVPNYEGIYQISSFGRVKSLGNNKKRKNRILRQGNIPTNYLFTILSKNKKTQNYYTHQLVAMVFLNHIPSGHKIVVDHIDNIRTNNFSWNLQLISNRKNTSKDRKNAKSKYVGVYFNKILNRWYSSIYYNRKRIILGYFDIELEASEYYQNALISIEKGTEIKVKRKEWSSKYKGVCWVKGDNRWKAQINVDGGNVYLGLFKNEYDAHLRYTEEKNRLNNSL